MQVKKHIVVDPGTILMEYDLFSSCEKVPVAVEDPNNEIGWRRSEMFPVGGILNYLNTLKKAQKTIRENPDARTILEYKLGGTPFYQFPMGFVAEPGWSRFMTPEIRKHMAEWLRKYRNIRG